LLGDDFQYPSSEGIPTWDWTCALYSLTREERDERYKFQPVYPELVEFITDRKQSWKERWRYMIKTSSKTTAEETIEGNIMSGIFSGRTVVRAPVKELELPSVSTSFAKREEAPTNTQVFKEENGVETAVAPKHSLQSVKEAVPRQIEQDPTELLAQTSFIPRTDVVQYVKSYEWVLDESRFYPRDTEQSHPNQFARAFGTDNSLQYSAVTRVLDQRDDLKQVVLTFIDGLQGKHHEYANLSCRKVTAKKMIEAANRDFQTYLTGLFEKKLIAKPGDSPGNNLKWSASLDTEEAEGDLRSASTVSTSMAARITRDIISSQLQQIKSELARFIKQEIQKASSEQLTATTKARKRNGKHKGEKANGGSPKTTGRKKGQKSGLGHSDVESGKERHDSSS